MGFWRKGSSDLLGIWRICLKSTPQNYSLEEDRPKFNGEIWRPFTTKTIAAAQEAFLLNALQNLAHS